MKEEWRDIPDWEGYYQVSNKGNVRSLDRWVPHGTSGKQFIPGKMMIPFIDEDGYYRFRFRKKGQKQQKYFGHRLVMMGFVGISDLVVNHKDGNRKNNNLNNLEYCTVRENVIHSFSVLGRQAPRGENSKSSKLKESEVKNIKIAIRDKTHKVKDLAELYGVAPSNISNIKKGRTWKHVTLEEDEIEQS